MLVEAWLKRAADAHPDRIALETLAERVSYGELLDRARAGAAALVHSGVEAGDRVAIALPAGPAFAEALHACLLRGAVAVPVDLRLRGQERAVISQGCSLTIAAPLATPASQATAPDALSLEHDLDAVAVVIHSSGTTGRPKAVELTYGNLLWSALGSAVALGLDPDERWLCTLPLSHVGGLSILIRSAIYATTAIVHDGFETARVLDTLASGEATLVSLVATTLKRLFDAGLREPPALRCALVGGGPIPAGLIARARAAGVPVAKTYGLTEACSQVTTQPVASLAARPGAHEPRTEAGVPLFCTRLAIGADGEILVAGPTVAPASLSGDGWLHTGDQGILDGHGGLRVIGRKSELIVSGGENVAPAEVQAAVETHMGVLEAAVIGRADLEWGEAVTAIVVVEPGARVAVDKLRAHCVRRLAPFKVPKQFVLTYAPLPRTRSGKLARGELLARWGTAGKELV